MSEYPKVTEWDAGFTVQYGPPTWGQNDIRNHDIAVLHGVLAKKMSAWVVRPNKAVPDYWVVEQPLTGKNRHFDLGTSEDNKTAAEFYAAKLNARENQS